MMLARLLTEIETAGRPLTPTELAGRIGVDRSEVTAMLGALRAHGRLAPGESGEGPPDGCAAVGSCRSACPGPADCPLVIDIGLDGLEPRRG